MRVLVTGATGFVGSFTAAALRDRGHAVKVLVRSPEKLDRTPALRARSGLEVVAGDITDPAKVAEALADCDAVVHCAALVALDTRRSTETRRINVEGTRQVIGTAAEAGLARIVYVSTVSLFGFGQRLVDVDAPLVAGTGPYARSKYDAERWVRDVQERGAPVTVTYPGGVYGPDAPGMNPQFEGMVFWVKYPPRMPGGTSVVDVRDVAAVHAAIVSEDEPPDRLMLGGNYLSWDRVCELIGEVTGRSFTRVPLPGSLLRLAGRIGDVSQRVWPRESKWTLESMQTATMAPEYDSNPARRRYGENVFRPPEQTFADTISWLAKIDALKASHVGKLA